MGCCSSTAEPTTNDGTKRNSDPAQIQPDSRRPSRNQSESHGSQSRIERSASSRFAGPVDSFSGLVPSPVDSPAPPPSCVERSAAHPPGRQAGRRRRSLDENDATGAASVGESVGPSTSTALEPEPTSNPLVSTMMGAPSIPHESAAESGTPVDVARPSRFSNLGEVSPLLTGSDSDGSRRPSGPSLAAFAPLVPRHQTPESLRGSTASHPSEQQSPTRAKASSRAAGRDRSRPPPFNPSHGRLHSLSRSDSHTARAEVTVSAHARSPSGPSSPSQGAELVGGWAERINSYLQRHGSSSRQGGSRSARGPDTSRRTQFVSINEPSIDGDSTRQSESQRP